MSEIQRIVCKQIQSYIDGSIPTKGFFSTKVKRDLLAAIQTNYSKLSYKEKIQVEQFYRDLVDKLFTPQEKEAIASLGKRYKIDIAIGAAEGYTIGYLAGLCLSKNYIFNIMTRMIGLGVGAYKEMFDSTAARHPEVDMAKLKQKLRDFSVVFHVLGFKLIETNTLSSRQTQAPLVSKM